MPVLVGQGYTVRIAVGMAAIFTSMEESCDLALIDLPSEDELRHLQTLRDRCGCAMIVIGPSHNDRLLVAALDHGADDYVQRPFRTDELLARVRCLLRRVQRRRPM
ncbi:MAG: response regulator [Chloroflexales bacterium]